MTADQARLYIMKPWSKDGNGPDSWNCWNLLRHLLLVYFNKHIPEVTLEDPALLRSTYVSKLSTGSWAVRQYPQHGFGVLLREGNSPHVGLYLDIDGGGVIHALEGHGVVFTPTGALRMMGFGRVKYYEVME